MHSFIVNLNTLTASLFLCVFFIILGSVSIKKNKKIIIQLILIHYLLNSFYPVETSNKK